MLHHSPAPLVYPNGKGTPRVHLREMSDAELVARYRQLHFHLCRRSGVPQRLLAPRDATSRKCDHVVANEHSYIEALARQRGLMLTLPVREENNARDPFGKPQRGDTVDTEFRDPDTREIIRERGVVENITDGRFGVTYHTRVNGKLYPLEKRGIKKIIFDS